MKKAKRASKISSQLARTVVAISVVTSICVLGYSLKGKAIAPSAETTETDYMFI